MQRFSQLRNTVPRIEPARVISAFCHGVRDKDIVGELGVHQPETMTQLFQLADMCALRQEGQSWHDPPAKQGTSSGTEHSRNEKKKLLKRKADEVLATGPPSAKMAQPGQHPAQKQEAFKPPARRFCAFHSTTGHDQTECRYIQASKLRRTERRAVQDKDASSKTSGDEPEPEIDAFQHAGISIAVITGRASSVTSRRNGQTSRSRSTGAM